MRCSPKPRQQCASTTSRLVRRAQEAGVLRDDIAPTDMLVLTMSVQATAGLAAATHRPDVYQRVLGIVLDGLRPSRSGPTPLPVPPLTDADLHSARAVNAAATPAQPA
jgi:hypothetical protein